jgi:N-acetyl-gamma-glutamyl-phosphate reductase
MIKVGVVGATGYAGQQLVWLLSQHPYVKIIYLSSHNNTDTAYADLYGNYYGFMNNNTVDMQYAEENLECLDVLFLALPHGKSFDIVKKANKLGVKVIDLGSDYRLKNKEVYKAWYGIEHGYEEILESSVYGLVELNREVIRKARLIANPGCYPTASILASAPIIKNSLVDPETLIIDAKSGVSGAGRASNISNLYCECNDTIKAYGVASHRHTPEIEQELGILGGKEALISFTPHLVPMNRGILSVCYAKLKVNISTEELYEIYRGFYDGEFFVKVIETLPETRWVRGSNQCHIGVTVDKRTGRAIIISAIDNLMKGAAGQALQNMNLMCGFDECLGLQMPAMFP